MEAIYNWLIGEMGKQGDFQYQAIHIHATLAVIVVTIFAVGLSFSKKLSDKQKRKMLVGISIFQLSFEVLPRCDGVSHTEKHPATYWNSADPAV